MTNCYLATSILGNTKRNVQVANLHAKLEANRSELEAVRSRLTDMEKVWIKIYQSQSDPIIPQSGNISTPISRGNVWRASLAVQWRRRLSTIVVA